MSNKTLVFSLPLEFRILDQEIQFRIHCWCLWLGSWHKTLPQDQPLKFNLAIYKSVSLILRTIKTQQLPFQEQKTEMW